MTDSQGHIARLCAEIQQLEIELADLEADILDMHRELDEFVVRYNRIVKPKTERLDVLKQMIADLEDQQHRADTDHPSLPAWQLSSGFRSVEEQFNRVWRSPQTDQPASRSVPDSDWQPPQDYVPVQEQFRRAWNRPLNGVPEPDAPAERANAAPAVPDDPQALKQLFRKLARRFHPDLTTDPAEHERRNRIMAEINSAYSRRDYGALLALDRQPDEASADRPLTAIQLQQLRQIRDQLDERLFALRQERHALLNSDMMDLKLQASLLAQSGRDLLQEMAASLDRDYTILLDHLDALRRSSG